MLPDDQKREIDSALAHLERTAVEGVITVPYHLSSAAREIVENMDKSRVVYATLQEIKKSNIGTVLQELDGIRRTLFTTGAQADYGVTQMRRITKKHGFSLPGVVLYLALSRMPIQELPIIEAPDNSQVLATLSRIDKRGTQATQEEKELLLPHLPLLLVWGGGHIGDRSFNALQKLGLNDEERKGIVLSLLDIALNDRMPMDHRMRSLEYLNGRLHGLFEIAPNIEITQITGKVNQLCRSRDQIINTEAWNIKRRIFDVVFEHSPIFSPNPAFKGGVSVEMVPIN